MKKILFTILATLCLAACVEENIDTNQQLQEITFDNVFTSHVTRSNGIVLDEGNLTKFYVWGYATNSDGITTQIFGNESSGTLVKKENGKWDYEGDRRYWIPDCTYHFRALAPDMPLEFTPVYDNTGNITFDANGLPVYYMGLWGHNGLTDYCYASYTRGPIEDNYDPVVLQFEHLLSKVIVSFTNSVDPYVELNVSNIELAASTQGSILNMNNLVWEMTSTGDYAFNNLESIQPQTEDSTGPLFIIPYKSNETAYSISYTASLIVDGIVIFTKDITKSIPGGSFQMGKAYKIPITINPSIINGNDDDDVVVEELPKWDTEDDTEFSDLEKILIAAKLGGEVTLSGNLIIPEIYGTIDVMNSLTINLNGYTLSYVGTGDQIFNITSTGSLTINDKANDSDTSNDTGEDNSSVVSNTCVANSNNGNVIINGGKYEVSGINSILTKESTGSVIVNKGLFLSWNPETYGFINTIEYRSVKTKIDNKEYYQVDKIVFRYEVTPSTSSNPKQDIINALDNPFVDKLVIDNNCNINNNGTSFYINHDIVIEGSTNDTDITTGGGAAYGFRIHGDYNVEIKNLDILGGGIYTTPEVDWDQGKIVGKVGPTVLVENCHFQAKYTSTSRQVIYVQSNGEVTLKNCDMTVEDTKGTHYILTSGAAHATIIKDTNVDYTPKNVEFTGGKYSNAGGFVGNVTIYGGTFDVDPTNWLAIGYKATNTGSTWTVGPDPDYVQPDEPTE